MRVARVTLELSEDSLMRPDGFRSTSTGEVVALLELGAFEVAMYGPPAALRRLSAQALAAAEHAEALRSSGDTRAAA